MGAVTVFVHSVRVCGASVFTECSQSSLRRQDFEGVLAIFEGERRWTEVPKVNRNNLQIDDRTGGFNGFPRCRFRFGLCTWTLLRTGKWTTSVTERCPGTASKA